jgi:hypothetical protein
MWGGNGAASEEGVKSENGELSNYCEVGLQ